MQAGRAAFGQAAALAGGAVLRGGRGDAGGGALSAAAECGRAQGAIRDGRVGWRIVGRDRRGRVARTGVGGGPAPGA